MKAKRTYILIADGGRARLLLSTGIGKPLQQVEGADYRNVLPPDRELARDRPTRVRESMSPARSASERDDLHERGEDRFARRLAEMLEERRAAGEFDRLAIIAAPETLATLRDALSEKLRAATIAEIAKDLVKVPNHEIRAHLEDVLPI
jgi:protein required for attachment to host cells